MMLIFALGWYAALLLFVQMDGPDAGCMFLAIAGFSQSLSLVPMSVLLLHSAGERFRSRIMGVRMLAIYGVPIGLLAAGVLIERIGFAVTASLYCLVGAGLTGLIALYWRKALWPVGARRMRADRPSGIFKYGRSPTLPALAFAPSGLLRSARNDSVQRGSSAEVQEDDRAIAHHRRARGRGCGAGDRRGAR
jgi:hypothetical protein